MTTGENVPGDSEIVEMLIVHFQSSIKFNSHSASTCYSNSVTEYTSGIYSYSSVPPSLFFFIYDDTPSSLHTPSSPPPSPFHPWQREGDCVNIIDDLEHMCTSLWRPTNTWSSDSLSIHLLFRSHFIRLVLALHPSPSLRPSHFPLSKFISLQVPSPFFPLPPPLFPAVYLYRRSLPMQCV